MLLELSFVIVATVLTAGKLVWIHRGVKSAKNTVKLRPLPWMIWAILTAVGLAPQFAKAGWEWAMMYGCANLVVNVWVLWLVRKNGGFGFGRHEYVTLVIAALGILFWIVSGNALFGVWFSLAADFVGVALVWSNANRHPHNERVLTWLLGACAAACATASAMFAGEKIVILYPLYVVGNATATALIVVARRRWPRPAVTWWDKLRAKMSKRFDALKALLVIQLRRHTRFLK